MKIIGFSFSKLSIERLSSKMEELKANANIDISEIVPVKSPDMIKTNKELLGIKFSYSVKYEPDYAKIEFIGDIVLEVEPKLAKEIVKDWKDKKVLSDEFKIFIFNFILRKSDLKALELEDDLNLPLHFPLSQIRKDNSNDRK